MALIDFDILAEWGTTNARLKEIFTAVPDEKRNDVPKNETAEEEKKRLARIRQLDHDLTLRERFRYETQTRVEEGIVQSLKNWRRYAAVDLAWDTSTISAMTIPLQMYAKGHLAVERISGLLSNIEGGQRYLKKGDQGKIEIDVPRFLESEVNLIRSIISRRHGAQKNKYNQLWPYYKYEARSTGLVAKLRADVLSQRAEIMVDQFGNRHHDAQVMRDAMLYAHSVDFVRSSWEVEKQYRKKPGSKDAKDVDTVITKEGIGWFNPHPSRVFWDNAASHGLASLNEDDIGWVGFWDVMRFSEIDDNPAYFNKTSVGWTGRFWGDAGVYNTYKDYFTHYSYTIIPPNTGEIDPAKQNDRKAIVGYYSGNQRDASVFVTNCYRKLVPKDWGIGNYPWPIWVRLVTASDSTVIFAEIMASAPGAYCGINENDGRQINQSMAMDLFCYQDAMSNLLTHLTMLCQIEVFKVIGVNKDLFEADEIEIIKKKLMGKNWYADPMVVVYSLAKLQESGINVDKAIQVHEMHQGRTITDIFAAMIKLVELCERLVALSPAESGQPAPREISATEVNEIANTTSSIYSSISEDIDEYRAAKKRIIYESLVACSKGDVVCPVKDRYTPKTIEAAGFKPKEGEDEDYNTTAAGSDPKSKRTTVIGSTKSLVGEYIFTTRDGAERPVNTQAANTLVQLIGQVMAIPAIVQALGKEKLYELFNEVFRLSGAGVDLNLTLKEGEDDSLGQDDIAQLKQELQQVIQHMQQMGQQVAKDTQDINELSAKEQEQQTAISHLSTLAQQVKKAVDDVHELQARHGEIQQKIVEGFNYKDAPPSIQRQMEKMMGFQPVPDEEHNAQVQEMKTKAAPKPATTTKK